MSDHYVHGAQVDPDYEREIREFISTPTVMERAYAAFEDRAEFAPRVTDEERCEREWTRMEADPDPNEMYHDRYLVSEPEWA